MGRPTFSELGVLGLYTESPLHCGAESGSGYVDLPIQRERHTHYPVIPSTTLKGVMRDELASPGGLTADEVNHFFGTPDASGPGCVGFGDGVLAAFPVRSSEAPFHWVTCPFVLERVLRAMGRSTPLGELRPERGHALAFEAPADHPHVVLEETSLRRVARPELFDPEAETSVVHALLELLPPTERGFGYSRQIFPQRLLIVPDADFAEMVEIGTEVVTRIKLNFLGTTARLKRDDLSDEEVEGRVKEDLEGNLFVQELVPPETLFLAPLRALEERPGPFTAAIERLQIVRIGGDETVGRGLTHTRWLPPPAAARKEV